MIKVQNSGPAGIVYVVSLPIGNAQDITKRAVEILEKVDLIATEDTRVLKQTLYECQIHTKARIFSYHEHNEKESSQELLKFLNGGLRLALTSDAGTPRLSDPGYDLIQSCYNKNIPVVAIPGASSLTAALSVSPVGGNTHFFGGFLPAQTKLRTKLLAENAGKADKIIYFESPHRLVEHLREASKIFGDDHKISIHRELTKHYEESEFNDISYFLKKYSDKGPKGEFVLIYKKYDNSKYTEEEIKEEIKKLLKEKRRDSEISASLAEKSDYNRKQIYKIIQNLKK